MNRRLARLVAAVAVAGTAVLGGVAAADPSAGRPGATALDESGSDHESRLPHHHPVMQDERHMHHGDAGSMHEMHRRMARGMSAADAELHDRMHEECTRNLDEGTV